MNDLDTFYINQNNFELSDFEKEIIEKIDKKINSIQEYIFENEDGFHISCGIVTSVFMLSVFGFIF
jgi:hypothetical protein